jgi:hypothetical protein
MATFTQKVAARLRLGRLPAAEGIWETAIFRHYRAPQVYCRYRRMGFIGYFALSERRLIARAKGYHEIDVNVAYDEPRFQKLTFAVQPRYLSLAFDASLQSPEASGQIEIRLHLPDAATAAQILEQAGAHLESNRR